MKTKTVAIFLIVILTLVLMATISTAIALNVRSEHKGIVCIYCHETKGYSIGEHEDEGGCDNCHDIKDDKTRLEAAHSNICNKCHNVEQNRDSYHQMHTNVDCQKCHGKDNKIPKVGMNNCAGCHEGSFAGGGGIHDVHKDKLEQVCTKCHGSRPGSDPVMASSGEEETKSPTKISDITKMAYAKVVDYRKYTIYEVAKKLFASF